MNYDALESLGYEDLFSDIIATESVVISVKVRLKKLKDWFINICKLFWEKVKTIYYNIRKKINGEYKSPKEKYDELMKAYEELKHENDEDKKHIDTLHVNMAKNSKARHDDAVKALHNIESHIKEKNKIIEEMRRNNTTLEQEKDKIQKEYDYLNSDYNNNLRDMGSKIKQAENSISFVLQRIGDAVTELLQYSRVVKHGNVSDTEFIDDYTKDEIGKQLKVVEDIIYRYNHDENGDARPSHDLQMNYFNMSVRNLRYEFFKERGPILEVNLKKLKANEADLNKLLDAYMAFSDENVHSAHVSAITTLLNTNARAMKLIINCMEM